VTYGQIRNPHFLRGIQKLLNCPNFGVKEAYNVARIDRKMRQEAKISDEIFEKTVRKFAVLDEKGNIAPIEEGKPGTYKIKDECMDDWKAAMEEFSEVEFTIESHPITALTAEKAGLTPNEVGALETLLNFEEAPTGEETSH